MKASKYAGQRRIFFLLDRATRKFHGDMGLWMQYADYARKQKSHKKMSQILTSALRLLPTKPSLWIYAANYAMESQSDMTEARSYMQRGLRFCKRSEALWLEYAKLELMYIAKIFARQSILGLDQPRQRSESIDTTDDPNADIVALPVITAEDIHPTLQVDHSVNHSALQNLQATPAFSGAIPIAIFDAAMGEFKDDSLGEKFFDLVATVQSIPCSSKILKHITEKMVESYSNSPSMLSCFIREPAVGVEPESALFPQALAVVFHRFQSSINAMNLNSSSKTPPKILLKMVHKIVDWLLSMIGGEKLDPDINTVLFTMLKRTLDLYRAIVQDCGGEGGHDQAGLLVKKLQRRGFGSQAATMTEWCSQIWPSTLDLVADEAILQ